MTLDEIIELLRSMTRSDGVGGNEMTHDELLAKIKEKGSADFATLKYNPEGQKDIQSIFKALRAVVELHEETCGEMGLDDAHRGMCVQDEQDYPCETRQAIEKELGVESK